jgi:type II secretory pathway pseudopilin PulG
MFFYPYVLRRNRARNRGAMLSTVALTRGVLVVVVIILVAAALLIGFLMGQGTSDQEAQEKASTAEEGITLSGDGAGVTRPFQLEQGLRVLEVDYEGAEKPVTYFGVRLLAEDENTPEATVPGLNPGLIFDELLEEGETFKGSKAVRIPQRDTYVLEIKADGPWTVNVH